MMSKSSGAANSPMALRKLSDCCRTCNQRYVRCFLCMGFDLSHSLCNVVNARFYCDIDSRRLNVCKCTVSLASDRTRQKPGSQNGQYFTLRHCCQWRVFRLQGTRARLAKNGRRRRPLVHDFIHWNDRPAVDSLHSCVYKLTMWTSMWQCLICCWLCRLSVLTACLTR